MNAKKAFYALFNTFFPCRCPLCGHYFEDSEPNERLCDDCLSALESSMINGQPGNQIERLFWAKLPIERASSLLRYQPESLVSVLLQKIKYENHPQLAVAMGKEMAKTSMKSGYFEKIDGIIPLPLTTERQRERGYNQSECLAQGISEITRIPVWNDIVRRTFFAGSQTKLSHLERQLNVDNVFELVKPEKVENRHILLVDDVITTGSSLLALGRTLCPDPHLAISRFPPLKISVLTLSMAGTHRRPLMTDDNWKKERMKVVEVMVGKTRKIS